MKQNKRQKLCQNCEGSVDLDVIVCPYCAADLREEKPEQTSYVSSSTSFGPKETAQSLYPPPYPVRETETPREEALSSSPLEAKEASKIIAPTVLFTLGVQLLLLGLLMLLFSHKGILILKWDAKYWFLYAFASVPFLYFGYRALSKL